MAGTGARVTCHMSHEKARGQALPRVGEVEAGRQSGSSAGTTVTPTGNTLGLSFLLFKAPHTHTGRPVSL